jgi:hypothetical protein
MNEMVQWVTSTHALEVGVLVFFFAIYDPVELSIVCVLP